MKDQKIAIKVYSPEQSECVQKMGDKCRNPVNYGSGEYPQYLLYDSPKKCEGFTLDKDDNRAWRREEGYQDFDFDTDGAEIRTFFAKKECPECGEQRNSGFPHVCSPFQSCPECHGDMSAGCKHKCNLKCPRCGKQHLVKIITAKKEIICSHCSLTFCYKCGGRTSRQHVAYSIWEGRDVEPYPCKCEKKVPPALVGLGCYDFWVDEHGAFFRPDRVFDIKNLYLTKHSITELFEHFATSADIEALYMKHCVSKEAVCISDTWAMVCRNDMPNNNSAPVDRDYAIKRRDMLNRLLKNWVKK